MLSKLENLKQKINSLPFVTDIKNIGGSVYAVGGIVRDTIIGKKSKDIDIIVTLVPFEKLISILEKHGKVDLVGESFGIIKFKATGYDEVDISLPRKEVFNGNKGHKAFDVITDPFLSIELDLIRRDLTINSIALHHSGEIIDPYYGIKDIENRTIRMTNEKTFYDDPLRMLRAVMFASRFNFNISENTLKSIILNSERIKEISSERILIELDKIVTKGSPFIGIANLLESNLFVNIFNSIKNQIRQEYVPTSDISIKTLGEFIYVCTYIAGINEPHEFYKNILKGDINTFKEIKALDFIRPFENKNYDNNLIFKAINISSKILTSDLAYKPALSKFIYGKLPKSMKDLQLNGDDFIEHGYQNIEIGKKQNEVLNKILSYELENDRKSLLNFIKSS